MELKIPQMSLVVLIGPAGAGKSTFAERHFRETEIVSSDFYRGVVCDNPSNQNAGKDAFEVVHHVVNLRLKRGLTTVVDATNLTTSAREQLRKLAKKHYIGCVAIVLNTPINQCLAQNQNRERKVSEEVIRSHVSQMPKSTKQLKKEGFKQAFFLDPHQMEKARILRQPMPADKRGETGPFDLIGDIHGCYQELSELLKKLGHVVTFSDQCYSVRHPQNRKLLFLGDLVDRGPDTPSVLHLVMDLVDQHMAICVPGNHEIKLYRKLMGHEVKEGYGLAESMAQLAKRPPEFIQRYCRFVENLTPHFVLDGGKLVVAHAGMAKSMIMRDSPKTRSFALWGDVSGEIDEFGLPVRRNWARKYNGEALIAYGHTPVVEALWQNNTVCLDTGCVFGGKLTGMRYPELELVSVPAAKVWHQPIKPLGANNSIPAVTEVKS